ncbi:site-specific integrase [Devosia sp.]|uniref:tyrosine-type recombinase/integrase n=1 Tax=Devosia sp. TaxID=1871048 RepID=UPI00344D4B6C
MDPSLLRKLSLDNSFDAVADEWIGQQIKKGQAEATITKKKWLLSFARKGFGSRPVSEVSPVEVLAVLRGIEARERLESANRARTTIGAVFRYAIWTSKAKDDPTVALKGALLPARPESRAAVTTAPEFGQLLRAIDGYSGNVPTRIALQLAVLLHPRPGELRKAEWEEFDFAHAVWRVPRLRMKMRRVHYVPLARQAVELLLRLRDFTGQEQLLFPGMRSSTRPMSENTLNGALRRLGFSKYEQTAHGLRASFSSMANGSLLWDKDVVERHLSHEDEDEVRAAYNRSAYWKERTQIAQWWADQCDELRAQPFVPSHPWELARD